MRTSTKKNFRMYNNGTARNRKCLSGLWTKKNWKKTNSSNEYYNIIMLIGKWHHWIVFSMIKSNKLNDRESQLVPNDPFNSKHHGWVFNFSFSRLLPHLWDNRRANNIIHPCLYIVENHSTDLLSFQTGARWFASYDLNPTRNPLEIPVFDQQHFDTLLFGNYLFSTHPE